MPDMACVQLPVDLWAENRRTSTERLRRKHRGRVNHAKSGRQVLSCAPPPCGWPREGDPYRRRVGLGKADGTATPRQPSQGRSSSVTSQVSSPAEPADEAAVGEK